jgi:hypothetical protein
MADVPRTLVTKDGSVSESWGSTSHGDGCACQRCRGFGPFNTVPVQHGAYSSAVRLARDDETREIADAIRESLPFATPGTETTVELLAITLRRVRAATLAIERVDAAAEDDPLSVYVAQGDLPLARLRDDLRGWIRLAAKLAESLALTPAAYGRLQRDLGMGADAGVRAHVALERLRRHVDERHPDVEAGDR